MADARRGRAAGCSSELTNYTWAELALKPRCEMSDEGNSRLEVLNSITTRTTIEVVNNILILCLNILRKSVTVSCCG